MDSTSSRELVNKEEKKQEPVFNSQDLSIFDYHPRDMQRHTLSFLVGNGINGIERSKLASRFTVASAQKGSFFAECKASLLVSAATKAVRNLAHRIKVNETLAFMRHNPNILQSLPFPIEIRDRHGRQIRRNCIIGALFALDELDVIEAKPEVNPSSLIPTIFSWFNKATDIRSSHITRQLQRQLKEESNSRHKLATKNRRANSLKEIKVFINKVIECTDILNDSDDKPFEDLLNLKFIQDFITTAFSPDKNDNGEEGIVWDFWQLNLDYIDLLKTYLLKKKKVGTELRPHIGDWYSNKMRVVDTAVWLAFLRCSQFCHLEASATGIGNISHNRTPPVRFDCSMAYPDILVDIGLTHFFAFYGKKLACEGGMLGGNGFAAHGAYECLCERKTSALQSLYSHDHVPRASVDDVEIRSSPVATAARACP